jgi:hypothetical protein
VITSRSHHRVVLLLAIVLVATLMASTSAQADRSEPPSAGADRTSGGTSYTRTFHQSRQRYFPTIRRCVVLSMAGTVTFRIDTNISYAGFFESRVVHKPTLTVSTYRTCPQGTGPYVGKNVYKISMNQRWSSSTCSSSVDIAVGAPWGASVGTSVSCGRSNLASRSTTYTGSMWFRTQHNSTTKVRFGNEYHNPMAYSIPRGAPNGRIKRYPLCFKVDLTAIVYPTRTSGSDSFTAPMKSCVRWW